MGAALALEGVTKSFSGHVAVDGLSFSVEPGEIFGFLGENGAGKTTTVRMALDIIRPDCGAISVLGRAPGPDNSPNIGFLAEERGLYSKMTAIEIVRYFGQLKGMKSNQAESQGMEILERFGIADRAKAEIRTLSKGMAQKVQLATALVNKPSLLLLDEPFSGLDPVNQSLLEDEILRMAKEGAAVVFSTHIMQNADRLCERMLILKKGQKKFEGTIDQARLSMPVIITLQTQADPRGLTGIKSCTRQQMTEDGWQEWEVVLKPGTTAGSLLQESTSQGMVLRKFEEKRSNMHEIFMWHVGKEQAR